MAGGLFDKAIAAYEALFGTSEADDLRAQLDDERSESLMLVQRIADLKWELRTARATIATLEGEIAALRQQIADARAEIADARAEIASSRRKLNTAHNLADNLEAELDRRNGDIVRQQYGEVDAWREAAKDVVQ